MKKIFAFILVMFNAFVIAGEQIPCKLKSNLIDTRDGGVSMQSSFNIELLGSNFAADPARPEGCEAKVTSTGKPNPRSIVLSTAAPSIANYSESIVISKGHVSNGALTFKRLSFLYGELDLVAQAHQGENALGELSGVLITGIWRTTDASGNVTEQEAFPALTPLNFNIHLTSNSSSWTLTVVNNAQSFPIASGQNQRNDLISSAFGALKESGLAENSAYVYFDSLEICKIRDVVVPCF